MIKPLHWLAQSVRALIVSIALATVRLACSLFLVRGTSNIRIEGAEHLPATGPVLIVARHFHHLYDGCLFSSRIPRQAHILVALDWIESQRVRRFMEGACRVISWPVVLRAERLQPTDKAGKSVYTADEVRPYLLRAMKDAVDLLRQQEVVAIFPEAYPTVDPATTPKKDVASFLPFRSGFIRLARMAEMDKRTRVAIVPAGLSYVQNDRWQITLRFGSPLYRDAYGDDAQLAQVIEERVQALSEP